MKQNLKQGMTYSHKYVVPEEKTVPYVYQESELFQAMPSVFATAFMVGLMEWSCMEALRNHMEENEISLGINVCVTHTSPTPPGMMVSVDTTLLEVNGSKTKWSVIARDEKGVIGEGTHERFSISIDKFKEILSKKINS